MDFGSDEPNGDAYHRVANRSSTKTSSGCSYGESKKSWNFAKYLFGFGHKSSGFRRKYDKDLSATRSAPAIDLSGIRTASFEGQTTSRTTDSLGTTVNGRNGNNSLKQKMRELAARQYQVEGYNPEK
ncbi:hypothetical protein RvY_01445 [Ramazzottius varieornatus]|uniref:Uncharacterized protein n=1 Tax=Ramazzottius varieornatus TaxID=947166 RepID=A0A1D1UGC1_RAMVA|nr:hypothetical protein RvY_01445 [Ramazzottius varieornatus]